jgi:hypothetical protein
MLFFPLFSKPYIKECFEDEYFLELEVFLKSKRCGQIIFSETKVNILISAGAYFYKGSTSVDEVILKHEKEYLVLFNHKQNKKMLSIKCSEGIFNRANVYLAAKQH